MSRKRLVDQFGREIPLSHERRLRLLREAIRQTKQEMLRARYDAAQTTIGNELHWKGADHLDPHGAASARVRRILRSRSRFEVIENNPYLKGIILSIANDFVGDGPKLSITDKRFPQELRLRVDRAFQAWARARRLRQKLWRCRIAKIVDGETFLLAFSNTKEPHPVTLDFLVIEADRVTSDPYGLGSASYTLGLPEGNEIDGVRFDQYEIPTEYHILDVHPGASGAFSLAGKNRGRWVKAEYVIHWFRQDRGWLRGVPELTPSLPLCSVLRRYTYAVVRHAELAASLTAIIESDGPADARVWTDENGQLVEDDPFETFPIEPGMITNLPWGYKLKQLDAVPLGIQFDQFVGAILREIVRPLLVPFNLASGTSKDANMASAIVDADIYKSGQKAERYDCNEVVLDKMFRLWWQEARLLPGFLELPAELNTPDPPQHRWRWPTIGLDHTDPQKVANALRILRENGFITDRDVQETWMGRSLEEWQEEILDQERFRAEQLERLRQANGPSRNQKKSARAYRSINGARTVWGSS